jgi:hypothetical protein
MWTVESVQFNYREKIEKCSNVGFWEDTWFGTSSLLVQNFPLYVMCNGHNKTIGQIGDGTNLVLTFRGKLSPSLMQHYYQPEGFSSSIWSFDDTNALIWQYENKGEYSTSSLYAILNFGGATSIIIRVVWNLYIPPRVHTFLWIYDFIP